MKMIPRALFNTVTPMLLIACFPTHASAAGSSIGSNSQACNSKKLEAVIDRILPPQSDLVETQEVNSTFFILKYRWNYQDKGGIKISCYSQSPLSFKYDPATGLLTTYLVEYRGHCSKDDGTDLDYSIYGNGGWRSGTTIDCE